MSTIKANYDALQRTANDLGSESKRIFRLALDMERIMTKIPMKCTSQSLAKLKMARQCIGVTAAAAKLMNFAVTLEEIGNVYKDADHKILVGGDIYSYAKHLIENSDGELSNDDKRRANQALKELEEEINKNGIDLNDKKTIALYNELYEKTHPEEAEKIKAIMEKYNGGHMGENSEIAKFMAYSSPGFSDDSIKMQFKWAKDMPPVLYYQLCDNQTNPDKYMGNANNVDILADKFGKNSGRYFSQGSTALYNFERHKNSDGSVDVAFTLSNSSKCNTEVTVYNADGSVKERIYMDGQRDPSSIPEVFSENGKVIKDIFTGKAFSVDSESYNSKKDFNFTIPKGGYIQITEDPSAMNSEGYIENRVADADATIYGFAVDAVEIKTGSPVADATLDIIKGAGSRAGSDAIKGNTSSVEQYADDAAWSFTQSVVTAGEGNPATWGLKAIDWTLKANTAAEKYLINFQQEKSNGNGSLYIYN